METPLLDVKDADFAKRFKEETPNFINVYWDNGKWSETKKKNLSTIVNREELIYLLKCVYVHKTTTRENILTIGMVRKSVDT